MLSLRGVSKTYGVHTALHPIELDFPAGKVTALLGPSGCGKSTLLRILVGLITPDQGAVRFQDRDIDPRDWPDYRRRIGYVIQEGGLFPHLTAAENVTLMPAHLGWKPAPLRERLAELASLAQLPTDFLDRYPVQLSGGQRQRVSLMRALFLDPDVLLLDEPLGALDPMIRAELQAELKAIFEKLRKTVVLVTHDIGEAGFLGDVIVMLRGGRILQQGALTDLVRHPADDFVRQFINAQRSPLESVTEDAR